MKKLYCGLLFTLLGLMLAVGVVSLLDEDPTVSRLENRKLKEPPEFSWAALWDGSYFQGLDEYYADTFPLRDQLLGLNRKLNQFYYYSGSDNVVAIQGSGGAEYGGENLDEVQRVLAGQDQPGQLADPAPEQKPADPPEDPEDEQPPADPNLDVPDEGAAVKTDSTIIIVGDNAMDIPTATYSIIEDYAAAVTGLAQAMGEGVQTYSLVTPNSGEFYSPESFHTGSNSQKDMIDYCYAAMGENVRTVDAYSALRRHVDEYIYFRTDHHWTARGAYWAYTAFCETAGLEAVDLDRFERSQLDGFLGTMYQWTSGIPQSETLKANPDYVEVFRPIVGIGDVNYYMDSTLSTPYGSAVIAHVDESVGNKYLTFIGGDTPIFIAEIEQEGPVVMVVKESYGNAFVPFLTSHYSKIIVVDPREFNRDGKPSLNLPEFAASQGVNDLIVINYPFMINSSSYISRLNGLWQ